MKAENKNDLLFPTSRFKAGEIVHERTHPGQKLIVSHYSDKLYYCKVLEAPDRKQLVYFERELLPECYQEHLT